MTAPEIMLAELSARLSPTFAEVVQRRRDRLTRRRIDRREDPIALLRVAARLYRWRRRNGGPEQQLTGARA